MQEIQGFLNRYSELNEGDEGDSDDYEEAGIASINAMGWLSTIAPMSERYGQPFEYFLDLEAETVYNLLLYHYRESKFSRNLAEIRKRRNAFKSQVDKAKQ